MRVGPPPLDEDLRAALGTPAVVRRLSSSPRSRVWLAEFDPSASVLPTPASPRITRTPLRPSLAATSRSSIRAASADRPRSIGLNVANQEPQARAGQR